MKVALFGDSYIARLGRFCNHSLQVPAEVHFFGKGGMTAYNHDKETFRHLLDFKPNFVIMNIDGNDINSVSKPRKISDNIIELISDIQQRGITVYFCEILERGQFPKDNELMQQCFNAQRNI